MGNKISIIVLCYNTASYLPRCLDSIINQTYNNIEIICVNDGSTDNTLEVLYKYSQIDKRIIIVSQNNTGTSGARNKGLDLCTGDYFTFVDSDDWISHSYIEKIIQKFKKTTDVSICGYTKDDNGRQSQVRLFDDILYYDTNEFYLLRKRVVGPVGSQLQHPETLDSYSSVCTKLFRTSIAKNNHIRFLPNNPVGEDMFFTVAYFKYAKSAICLPYTEYFYRRNRTSVTRSYNPTLLEQWTRLYDYLWDIVKNDTGLQESYFNRKALSIIGMLLNQVNVSGGFYTKRNKIFEILNSTLYKDIYKAFDTSQMPIHWRFFFYLVKHNRYTELLCMLKLMNFLR